MVAWNPQANEIFLHAVDIGLLDERRAYVEQACGGDAELLTAVGALLEASEQAGDFLESPPSVALATVEPSPVSEGPGESIGPYKLLEQIGEGGMGLVFMAEQQAPLRRKVALKVIKPGMDTRQVIARFEAERQALALMDHPHIAKVLDAGATQTGRPYFVMELVRGVPITEYCDRLKLPMRDRLQLFVAVCQAVQHAHQKGIIHRDLKPSNVLVTLHDGTGVPKVIDFGVAKAIDQQLTERTLFTQFSQMIGTPQYMSPEQAELSGVDIDTRADVYSLGVLVYELLTGTTPIPQERLESVNYDEMCRIIREEDPLPPGARLETLGESLTTVSAQRGVEPQRLSLLVRGELDWIAIKALEKDRTRRYETAEALAADVQRYLRDEPVQACPPSAMYRLRKFVRRNRPMVFSAVLLVLTAVATLAVSSIFILGERAEAIRQRDTAEAHLLKADGTVDKYFRLISESTLLDVPGLQPLRKELLSAALAYYEDSFEEQPRDPRRQADLAAGHIRVAQIQSALDHNEEAMTALRRGLKMVETLLAEHPGRRDWPPRLAASFRVGRNLHHGSEHPTDVAVAVGLFDRAIGLWERLITDNPEIAGLRSDLAGFHNARGELELALGRRVPALATQKKAAELWQRLVDDGANTTDYRAELASSHGRIGVIAIRLGYLSEAKDSFRRALELWERLAAAFPQRPDYQLDLAEASTRLATPRLGVTPSESGPPLRRAQQVFQKLVDRFPQVPSFRENLAISHLQIAQRVLRPLGQLEQAEAALRVSLAHFEKLAGDHPTMPYYRDRVAHYSALLASFLIDSTRAEEARKLYEDAAALLEEVVTEVPTQPLYRRRLAQCYTNFGYLLTSLDRSAEAEKVCRKALGLREKLLRDFRDVPLYHCELASLLATCPVTGLRDPARAIDLASQSVKAAPSDPMSWQMLGVAHYAAGNWAEAMSAVKKSLELRPDGEGFEDFVLAVAHQQFGHEDESRACYEKAVQWLEKNRPDNPALRHFRGEVENLLGITGKQPPTKR